MSRLETYSTEIDSATCTLNVDTYCHAPDTYRPACARGGDDMDTYRIGPEAYVYMKTDSDTYTCEVSCPDAYSHEGTSPDI